MWDRPDFLELPQRDHKPRRRGLTHVLDKGMTPRALEAQLAQTGEPHRRTQIGGGSPTSTRPSRTGWPCARKQVSRCASAGHCLRCASPRARLTACGGGLRVSASTRSRCPNGLQPMRPERKTELIRSLSADFVVLAETGAKDGHVPVVTASSGWPRWRPTWPPAPPGSSPKAGRAGPSGCTTTTAACATSSSRRRNASRPRQGHLRGPEEGPAGRVHPPVRGRGEPGQRVAGTRCSHLRPSAGSSGRHRRHRRHRRFSESPRGQ